MLSVTIKSNVSSNLKKIQNKLDQLPKDAYQYFKSITPKRTGNARRKTKFDSSNDQIHADYPYAQRLDEGYSPKAPKGMTKPTEDYVKKQVKKIIKGK